METALLSFVSKAAAAKAGNPLLAGLYLGGAHLDIGGKALTLGHALKGAGLAAGFASTAYSSATAEGQAAYQAARDREQAAIYARAAERERALGAVRAERKRQETERIAATQRARMAGGGGGVSSGSALLAQRDVYREGALQGRLIEEEAAVGADAHWNQHRFALQDAAQRVPMARRDSRASYLRAGSTLLDGIATKFG